MDLGRADRLANEQANEHLRERNAVIVLVQLGYRWDTTSQQWVKRSALETRAQSLRMRMKITD